MATDQGKTSDMNALAIVADGLARPLPEVGLTTFRMPYTPVTFGALAGYDRGDLFEPVRTTPMHEWARRHGAVFEDVGQWKRARFFPQAGEDMHAAVARECRAVRSGCGMFDASTLGKIEVTGPDAATFLSRMYVNDFASLAVGRSRYGILLRDDGFIYDDGVIARIADDRFHVTTTTGGAARCLRSWRTTCRRSGPGCGPGSRRRRSSGRSSPCRVPGRATCSRRSLRTSTCRPPHCRTSARDGTHLRRPDAPVSRELHG